MKKRATTLLCGFLAAVLLTLCGCTNAPSANSLWNSTYGSLDNLSAGAAFRDKEDKELKTFQIKDDKSLNNHITVDLRESKTFNTITLGEKGKDVTLFSIYASNEADKDYKLLYQGDTIEGSRMCYVGDVTYRYLQIFITGFEKGYAVNELGIYQTQKTKNANDLRVNAYLVADNITEKTDFSMLDSVTDIIFFGMANFNAKGDIVFYDDNKKETDDTLYAQKLQLLKNAIGDRDINLIVDVHVPYGNDNKDINAMMGENLDNTVKSIQTFVEKYGFDGYDIDYEYPSDNKEWKLYNEFLRRVHAAMPEKLLSIATAPWALKFDKDVIEAIDRVELMLYDGFDTHGYQATFPYAVDGVQTLLDRGFQKEQIDLGVPFYSRPVDGHAYWGIYKDFVQPIGQFNNLIPYNGFDHDNQPMTAPQYFNSYQMIADKTAYIADAGIGGIMIWHMTCDTNYENELSLFRAIHETKLAKQP